LKQVGFLLKPFKEVSVYMEGERYPTVPEYLGRLATACYLAFYHNTAQVVLEPKVATLKRWLCEDIGRRLWDTVNDVTLVGLALHPVYKLIAAPDVGIAQQWYAEYDGRNILTFFFRDLRKRMTDAILRELKRLNIKSAPLQPNQWMLWIRFLFLCLGISGRWRKTFGQKWRSRRGLPFRPARKWSRQHSGRRKALTGRCCANLPAPILSRRDRMRHQSVPGLLPTT
jgi:hypothetical protein